MLFKTYKSVSNTETFHLYDSFLMKRKEKTKYNAQQREQYKGVTFLLTSIELLTCITM